MATVTMRDRSRSGHAFDSAELVDLPSRLTVRELLAHRVRADVADHARSPGRTFRGLIQPSDAVRYSDGHRLPAARTLDPEPMVAAAHEAMAAGMLRLRVGDRELTDLDAVIELEGVDEVVAELRRPIVARGA